MAKPVDEPKTVIARREKIECLGNCLVDVHWIFGGYFATIF